MLRLLILIFFALPFTGLSKPDTALIPFRSSDGWGYSDTNGRVVISPQLRSVDFFSKERAVVGLSGSGDHYCLIDRNGNYIIPPSRHWNGRYGNWSTNLNCFDSTGRWGLIDSNNRLLIPFEFDPLCNHSPDSYYSDILAILSKNGMYGAIDRAGKTLVPFKYKSLTPLPQFTLTHSFFKFSDSVGGPGKCGILDVNANVILPPTYLDISYNNEYNKTGFVVMKEKKSRRKPQEAYEYKRLSYPSLKERSISQSNASYYTQPIHEEKFGNNILFHHAYRSSGLKDSLSKVLIPEGSIHHVTDDTIVLYTYKCGYDTIIFQYTYLNASTLLPYCDPVKKFLYTHPLGNTLPTKYGPNQLSSDMEQFLFFYKDSFLFTANIDESTHQKLSSTQVSEEMKKHLEPFIVSGRVHKGSTTSGQASPIYGAVVDRNKNYIIPPIEGAQIFGYNKADDIIIVVFSNQRFQEYNLINSRHDTLCKFSTNNPVQGAYRWHGNFYAAVKKTKPLTKKSNLEFCEKNGIAPTREVIQVVDVRNTQKDTWGELALLDTFPRAFLEKGEVGFIARDTDGRCKIVAPDGSVLNQKLSGKYSSIIDLRNGYFMVAIPEAKGKSKIVDKDGQELIPGLLINKVSVLSGNEVCDYPYGEIRSNNANIPIPLMMVDTYIKDWGWASFYVNYNGVAYTDLITSKRNR